MIIKEKDKIDMASSRFKIIQKSGYKKFLKLDNWLDKESRIFETEISKKAKNYVKLKRGEIIKVDFGINIGSELSHTHFAIVLNSDDTMSNDNVLVIPITSKNGYKRVFIGKILKNLYSEESKYNLDCYAFITQIRTISKSRIFKTKNKYICSKDILNNLDKALVNYLTNPKIKQIL